MLAGYVDNGPTRFAPGYDGLLRMTGQLLAEKMAPDGTALIVGAGGGNELLHLATTHPTWHFCAVDPTAAMLDIAKHRLTDHHVPLERIDWIEGDINAAPAELYDGACCLMVLHVIAGMDAKQACLSGIRARLKPGAHFIIANNCIDLAAPNSDQAANRYLTFARDNGAPEEIIENARSFMQRDGGGHMLAPDDDVALLQSAGFVDVELIYAGLSWRGWCATAP